MNKYDIIHTIYPMPKASVDKLVENIAEVAYPKGSLILEAGKTERNIFFVRKGIVRATVVSLKSYIGNAPGYETVECMEDVILYVLKQSVLARLFQEDIHIANWGRKFAETEFLQTEEKFIPLLFTSAAERYEALLKNNPELLQRIPLECLATYLGITPVSLSRIRAGIGKR